MVDAIEALENTRILCVPYSWKYWWELNLVVGPQIAIAKKKKKKKKIYIYIYIYKFDGSVRDHHT